MKIASRIANEQSAEFRTKPNGGPSRAVARWSHRPPILHRWYVIAWMLFTAAIFWPAVALALRDWSGDRRSGRPVARPPDLLPAIVTWGIPIALALAGASIALITIHRVRRRLAACGDCLCGHCAHCLMGLSPKGCCPECGKPYEIDPLRNFWSRWRELPMCRHIWMTRLQGKACWPPRIARAATVAAVLALLVLALAGWSAHLVLHFGLIASWILLILWNWSITRSIARERAAWRSRPDNNFV